MELQTAVSYYPWAKRGKESMVGRLSWENAGRRFEIDPNAPYAILWVGTHRNGRCTIKGTLKDLGKYLKENPHLMGIPKVNVLPFMLRILSVKFHMAVKCHPDKEQCRILHKDCPLRYTDRMSKDLTFISIGISHFLVGIRRLDQIRYFLTVVPELSVVIPSQMVVDFIHTPTASVKELLFTLFTSEYDDRKLAIDCFLSRMESSKKCVQSTQYYELVKSMHQLNPYDPGIFSPFFFNHVILPPGTGLFVPARVIYSVLSGDFVECASNSVTALKIGLTKLFTDIYTFIEMADLRSHDPDDLRLPGEAMDICRMMYKSPVQEATVDRITVSEGISYTLPIHESCSMFLIVRGYIQAADFRQFRIGASLFLPSNYKFTFKAKEDTTIYRIYYFP